MKAIISIILFFSLNAQASTQIIRVEDHTMLKMTQLTEKSVLVLNYPSFASHLIGRSGVNGEIHTPCLKFSLITDPSKEDSHDATKQKLAQFSKEIKVQTGFNLLNQKSDPIESDAPGKILRNIHQAELIYKIETENFYLIEMALQPRTNQSLNNIINNIFGDQKNNLILQVLRSCNKI